MSREIAFPSDDKLDPQLVQEALEQELTPDQAQQVLKAIIARSAEAKTKEHLHYTQLCAANLAIAAHQNSSPKTPSRLDVISWERFTRDTSFAFLSAYSKLGEADKSTLPVSVLRFATGYVFFRELHAGEDLEEATKTLNGTGFSAEDVHQSFVDAMIDLRETSESPLTKEQVLSQIPNAESLSRLGWPNEIFDMWEATMREDLVAAGYKLPKLTDDGSYGLKEGATGEYPADFVSPVPDDSMIPGV